MKCLIRRFINFTARIWISVQMKTTKMPFLGNHLRCSTCVPGAWVYTSGYFPSDSGFSNMQITIHIKIRQCRDFQDVDTRKLLYCSIVRPKLEYASELWSPYTAKHKLLLENVQPRAIKFILNYTKDVNYKDRLLKQSFLPQEYRREMQDFVLIFKSRVGLEDQGHTLLYLISLSIYLFIFSTLSTTEYYTPNKTI